jgi:hypothetical protein
LRSLPGLRLATGLPALWLGGHEFEYPVWKVEDFWGQIFPHCTVNVFRLKLLAKIQNMFSNKNENRYPNG